jgi:predicted esterase YcpF (UPF0227 family)
MSDDTRDRVIALERDMQHMSSKVDEMAGQVKEMHQLLMQARGAKWAIVGLATVGGFISAKLSALFPWFSSLPR